MTSQAYCHKRLSQGMMKEAPSLFIKNGAWLVLFYFTILTFSTKSPLPSKR
ncbi:MAG: hypothetical protein ACJAYB_001655 [Psychromonas sp.]|jgi:hypothetical protein